MDLGICKQSLRLFSAEHAATLAMAEAEVDPKLHVATPPNVSDLLPLKNSGH